MLTWTIFGFIVIFLVAFWLGATYGAYTEREECIQMLYEAKRILVEAKTHSVQARAIARTINEKVLKGNTEEN